jgi:hypothetical protein
VDNRTPAALFAAALALAACDDPAPPPPAPSVAPSARPLRLPVVAPGEQCPVAAEHPWSGPGQAGSVLGDGPLYPIAGYFADGAVLELRDADRKPDGSYEKKVRWLGVGYTGPVLVRAGRIDGAGTAGATFSYRGTGHAGGHYAELSNPVNDLPATTTVSGPGCYAYQVDGTTFSKTIVFRAVEVN